MQPHSNPRTHSIQFGTAASIVLFTVSVVLAAWGLWWRNSILNSVGDWGWNSTARFHVWPPPYRVAVVLNIPAFFVTGLVGSVLGLLFGSYGAVASAFIAAGSVWFQWRWIGKWVDRHLSKVPANSVEAPAFPSWLVVIIAGIVAIVGVGLALESLYVSFIGWGIALWAIAVGLAVLLVQRRRAHKVRELRPEI